MAWAAFLVGVAAGTAALVAMQSDWEGTGAELALAATLVLLFSPV